MLVAVGKGIELEVDVRRFNSEVRDHVMRTGLRNLLMDAHASATAKADPENYIKRSRELAEKKLASLYAGVVRAHSIGGPRRRLIQSQWSFCGLRGKRSSHGLRSQQRRRQVGSR